jgi:hemerythrin-like domain-containing protein
MEQQKKGSSIPYEDFAKIIAFIPCHALLPHEAKEIVTLLNSNCPKGSWTFNSFTYRFVWSEIVMEENCTKKI